MVKNKAGFTLIELMIVMIIMSVSLIASGYLYSPYQKHKMTLTSEKLISFLQLGRLTAIEKQRTIVIESDNWNKGCTMHFEHDPKILKHLEYHDIAVEIKLFGHDGKLKFTPDGRSSTNGTIKIVANTQKKMQQRIILHKSGRLRSEKVT